MLKADGHNIFGSGGGTGRVDTFKPGAVLNERPTDGSLFYSRHVLGTGEPVQYVMVEPAACVSLNPQEVVVLPQSTIAVSEAAARIGLNAQLEPAVR